MGERLDDETAAVKVPAKGADAAKDSAAPGKEDNEAAQGSKST